MKFLDRLGNHSPIIVRFAICFVFLWFGINEMFNGNYFVSYLPSWLPSLLGVKPLTFIFYNGLSETILGVLLLTGLFTRLAALILCLHLLSIALNLGYTDIAIRDFGLTAVAFSIFLHGPDDWCLDRRIKNKALAKRS